MKQRLLMMSVGLVFVVGMTALAEDVAWQNLCDGNSLAGWVQRGGEATYRVENGAIIGTTKKNSANTFLCTEKDYGNFVLELELKVSADMNSGIQIRSNSFQEYKDDQVHGYQVEVDPSDRSWSGGIYEEGRRGWLCDLKDKEAAQKAFKKSDWNQYRIECNADSIKTWVNGVPVSDVKDFMTSRGFIGLQVHGTDKAEPMEVQWRNIRIQDLDRPNPTPVPYKDQRQETK